MMKHKLILFLVGLGLLIGLIDLISKSVSKKKTEAYTSGYLRPGWNCTDGCIIRVRNKGVYVDNECANMCVNKWDRSGCQEYANSLANSINSGAFMYMNGV
jgi:hypothetical protein